VLLRRRPVVVTAAALTTFAGGPRLAALLFFALALFSFGAFQQSLFVLLLLLPQAPLLQGVFFEGLHQALGHGFAVQKIAKAGAAARSLVVVAAAGLPKVGDGTEFALHLNAVVVAVVEVFQGVRRLFLVRELDVAVANHVVAHVVDNVQAVVFDATVFGQFHVKVFVKDEKVFQRRGRVDRRSRAAVGMAVNVLDENRGRKGGLVVQPTAAIAVATGADFEIKGAIDAILLGSVDSCEVLRHGC